MAETFSARIMAAVESSRANPQAEPKLNLTVKAFPKRIFAAVVALAAIKAVFFPTTVDYRAPILQTTRNVVWCRQQMTQLQSMVYCTGEEKKLEELWRLDEEQRIRLSTCRFCIR